MSGWTKLFRVRYSGWRPCISGLLMRSSIRSSLLLGFGAMTGIASLSVLVSLYFFSIVSSEVDGLLESQLPITVHVFQVARAADALTASGLSLATLSSRADREATFQRVGNAAKSLDAALADFKKAADDADLIPLSLLAELKENLNRLKSIVDERIMLQEKEVAARRRLLANLQVFQRQLVYRTRILQGDGDVISRLLMRPVPPVKKVADIAGKLAKLLPVARLYAMVEATNGRILVASLSPTLANLNTSRHELAVSFSCIRETMTKLPQDLGRDLNQPFEELKEFILDDDGLIRLRERELLLLDNVQKVNAVNQGILQEVNSQTARLVSISQSDITRTSAALTLMRRRSMLILVFVAVLALFGVLGLMHFYVDRHIITRLSWLSTAMQDVAAGRLDVRLPPAGPSELGRLGGALRQFRATAAESREREIALQASNQRATQAIEALEEKTAELALANNKLKELSIRDPLTGLYNRRHMEAAFKRELKRAKRRGRTLTVIMVDIDHFKKFNDTHGHNRGDEVLREVSDYLNSKVRTEDILCRYGGEELLIIMPECSLQDGLVRAEEFRQGIHEVVMVFHSGARLQVTASLGVAAFPLHGESMEALIAAADKALYCAKDGGRNQVISYES